MTVPESTSARDLARRVAALSPEKRAALLGRLQANGAPPALRPPIQPVPRDVEALPLSAGQRRLWFLDQLEGPHAAYNIPVAWRLSGQLDLAALRSALKAILDRHEILRSCINTVGGEPRLTIAGEITPDLRSVDVTTVPDAKRGAFVQDWLARESRQPFDLAVAPLLRAHLLRLSDDEHVLALTFHHIVTDGWSSGVLNRELGAFYRAALEGHLAAPGLAPLEIQYVDYAAWQRDWLQGSEVARQLDFWRATLAEPPARLELPTDRPRPAVQSTVGAVRFFTLPEHLTEPLKALARSENATLFMVLLAAFEVLLGRYSGQTDFAVGTPIANRVRPELEPLIGFFVNTLVLRADLSGRPSFRTLLQRARATALDAFGHQDVPFERLVDELHVARSLSHHPLFQVMFALQNAPASEMRLPGLTLTSLDVQTGGAQFDVSLYIWDEPGGLVGRLEFNTDLFDDATLARFARHYERLLEAIVAAPETAIDRLPLMPDHERDTVLRVWSGAARPAYPPATLTELFAAQAALTPERVALLGDAGTLTYAELDARASRLAAGLAARGVGRDAVVGICLERSLDAVVAILAVLKTGGAYLPLDPAYPAERLAFMVTDSGTRWVLTRAAWAALLAGTQAAPLLLDETAVEAHDTTSDPRATVAADDLAYVIYTSGSTGRPKGVRALHRGAVNRCRWMWDQHPFAPNEVCCQKTALSFVDSIWEIFGPLLHGVPSVVVPDAVVKDPERLIATLAEHRVTRIVLVPSLLRLLLDVAPDLAKRLPDLTFWVTSGETLSPELLQRFRDTLASARLLNLYGSSEVAADATAYDTTDWPGVGRVPIGRPIPGLRAYVLDAHGEPTPPGVPGEIHIGGAGLARDYAGRPDLTAERFVVDAYSGVPGARLYRTGDLGRFLDDGVLDYVGRLDHQVKVKGFRIELGEIEQVLAEHAEVETATVVVREDRVGDRVIVAYVVPRAPALTVAALRAHLKSRLPEYMLPGAFVLLPALPLTPNGKLDRAALPAPQADAAVTDAAYAAPTNAEEERIVAIWADVLGRERVGIDDNFFDLGGESFKAVRAARRIGEHVAVMDLFKHPTVRRLATALAQGAARHGDRLLHELTPPTPPERRTLTVLAFPFAGGDAVTYQPLANALPAGVSLFALQMPGHDFSRRDEPLQTLPEIARRCADEIVRDHRGPLMLYGHCLGGAMTLAVANELDARGADLRGVLIGGHFPSPRLPGRVFELLNRLFPMERWTARRSALEFLRSMGFFTDALSPTEQDFVIRNFLHDARDTDDFYTQLYNGGTPRKLAAPIACVIGQMDRATELYEERYSEWEVFSDDVRLAVIPGAGHYFMKHQANELSDLILTFWSDWRKPNAMAAAVRKPAPKPGRPTTPTTPSLAVFYLIAFGQFISLIGSSLTAFAMGVWVYEKTQRVEAYAFILMGAIVPAIVLAPIAGAIADRWDRRRLMILSDLAAGCGTLALAILLWTGRLEIWHTWIVAALNATATAFQQPAYMAAISQLVPKRYYGRANGIAQLGAATGGLLAPLVGGLLVLWIGLSGVILIDFATFLFAVTTTSLVRFPDLAFKKLEEPFWVEVTAGWRYITRRRGLVAIILFTVIVNYFYSVMEVLVPPLVLQMGDPAVLGLVLAALGAGTLAGSVVMSLWGGTPRRTDGILACVLGFGLSTLIIGVQPQPIFPIFGLFGIGLSIAILNAHWLSIVQTKVGLDLQGRVMATNLMIVWSMVPLGYLTAGPLADRVFEPLMRSTGGLAAGLSAWIGTGAGRGMGLMLVLAGVFTTVWAIAGSRYRPIRYLEDALPDAIPDPVIAASKDTLQDQADRLINVGGTTAP